MTDTPLTRSEPRKYQYIDVMRGLAILMVVYTHTLPLGNSAAVLRAFAGFGQMGVQLFFVASALTLYLSMSSRGLSRREVTRFYVRRWFRIAPLYYVGIAFYYLIFKLNLYSVLPLGSGYSAKTILANLLLLHGLVKAGNNTIVPGGWSVGCEVLFYAVFPLIFALIKSKKSALFFIAGAMIINVLVQIVIAKMLHKPLYLENDSFSYFLIFNQMPVFGCGIVLYFLLREPAQVAQSKRNLLLALAAAALMVAFWYSDRFFGLAFAFVPLCAGVVFLFTGLYLSQLPLQSALWNAIAEIGRKSFSIYVFHFVFAWSFSILLGQWLIDDLGINANLAYFVSMIATLGLTYLVAIFTQRYIESVGISAGKRLLVARDRRRELTP